MMCIVYCLNLSHFPQKQFSGNCDLKNCGNREEVGSAWHKLVVRGEGAGEQYAGGGDRLVRIIVTAQLNPNR